MVVIISKALGRRIDRNCIQRLMQAMGLQGTAPALTHKSKPSA